MPDCTSPTPLVFLFPGQGSQYYQMGRELFDGCEPFRTRMQSLDRDFARQEGYRLLDELYGPRSMREPLEELRYSHPLVVMIEYCLARTLVDLGLEPDLLIASSVGEFAAQAFAGQIAIEAALGMVAHQARSAAVHVEDGFMMAVMAPRQRYDECAEMRALACMAGSSFPGAFVVAGVRRDLAPLQELLRRLELSSQVLPLRVPFHTPWVEAMRPDWLRHAGGCEAAVASVPVIGQFDHPPGTAYADAMWRVIREPFDFQQQLQGLEASRPYRFVDVGPAGTLANWIKHGGRGAGLWQSSGILSPWGGDLARLHRLAGSPLLV